LLREKDPKRYKWEQPSKLLDKKYDYKSTRQTGSHIRLTTQINGEHHITIPNHDPIKLGTLSAILSDIAVHQKKTKEQVINELF
jgi:predicted RNA binding protein YcfA (HicA-like mRNA interferase family)